MLILFLSSFEVNNSDLKLWILLVIKIIRKNCNESFVADRNVYSYFILRLHVTKEEYLPRCRNSNTGNDATQVAVFTTGGTLHIYGSNHRKEMIKGKK